MAKDPAFLFYSKDWLQGTAEYMPEEKGVYIDLLCHQHNNGSLPSDTTRLARMVGLSHEQFIKIWSVISVNFQQIDNRLVNRKLNQVMTERAEKGKLNTITGTFASILRKGNFSQKEYKLLKTKFKPSDFMDLEKEQITERLTEWITECLTIASKSIEDENGNEEDSSNDYKILTEQFEIFRQSYPGTKRGLDVEFENFTKKNKNWKDIIPLLSDALTYQKSARELKRQAGGFVPEWKNLQTWINQKCWEEEIETNNISNEIYRRNNKRASDGSGVGDVITEMGEYLNIPK